MNKSCTFCNAPVSVPPGVVDIGGLKLCIPCYEARKNRTSLPCSICNTSVRITPNLLMISTICGSCEKKADLSGTYQKAYRNNPAPCDTCSQINRPHHATIYGQNLCHVCYDKAGCPCTQIYSGDKGYPAFPSKPSLPALILPIGTNRIWITTCVSCSRKLFDPDGLSLRFQLPTICERCDGPVWWDVMRDLQKHDLY